MTARATSPAMLARLLIAVAVTASACSPAGPSSGDAPVVVVASDSGAVPNPSTGTAPVPALPPPAEPPAGEPPQATQAAGVDRSPLAELVAPIGTATYDPAEHVEPPQPTTISIDRLRVEGAPIAPVGALENGELDVPDPLIVGWYRGSSVPGAAGASVLAAHVNFDGVPGVFRYLRDLDGGEEVEIGYDDGTSRRFVVTEVTLYDKDELPDRVWAKEGDPSLVLFTCGGRYDSERRSYEDNVVAYATPIG